MLFQLLSSSDDMEVAGAAFVTMSTLLRDATLPDLLLDPAYGLPAGVLLDACCFPMLTVCLTHENIGTHLPCIKSPAGVHVFVAKIEVSIQCALHNFKPSLYIDIW